MVSQEEATVVLVLALGAPEVLDILVQVLEVLVQALEEPEVLEAAELAGVVERALGVVEQALGTVAPAGPVASFHRH